MRILLCITAGCLIALSISSCSSSSSAQSAPAVAGEATTGATPYVLTKLGSGLFLFISDIGTGYEPWVTDGTTEGTFQLAETFVGTVGGHQVGVSPFQIGKVDFMVRGGEAYFVTYPGDVWRTDGTIAGTFKVVDLSPDGYEFLITTTSLNDNELTVGGCLYPLSGARGNDCKVVTIDLG